MCKSYLVYVSRFSFLFDMLVHGVGGTVSGDNVVVERESSVDTDVLSREHVSSISSFFCPEPSTY